MLFVHTTARVEGSIRQTDEVSEETSCDDFRKEGKRGEHPGPAGHIGEGGGSRWCREVSGSGTEDEHHLGNSTPVRCQSRTGSKRPFIPQPCTIDLFIPAPSLSLTISASLPYHFSLPPFLCLLYTTPTPRLPVLTMFSFSLLLPLAVLL